MGEQSLLTSGFGQDKARQLIIRDIRKIETPLYTENMDVSAGKIMDAY